LFDYLIIEVEINVSKAGDYKIKAELENRFNDTKFEDYLDIGIHTIKLNFNGNDIHKHRKNGPYILKKVLLYDKGGVKLEELNEVYSTSNYSYWDFEYETIPLSSCGFLDIYGADYELQEDIIADGTCFVIKAENIILDLNGHDITGSGSGEGVYVRIYNGAIIKNGKISNFAEGIRMENSDNNIIENNTFENNGRGIYIFRGKGNNISQDYIYDNGAQIELDGSDDNLIDGNYVGGGGNIGIQIFNSNNNILIDNHIENNQALGIDLNVASNNIVEDNLIEHNGAYGIYIGGGNNRENKNNIIKKNKIFQNERGGIRLTSANNLFNSIISNVIDNNYGNGIELRAVNENNIYRNIMEDNIIEDNWEAGILILGAVANDNVIINNQIKRQDYGILIRGGKEIFIDQNYIKDNDEGGIVFNEIIIED